MLYKIVPFLVWLDMQRVLRSVPHMHGIIPEAAARRQLGVFCVAVACLFGGAVWRPLAPVGGALFASAYLWLEWNLCTAAFFVLRPREGKIERVMRGSAS